MTRPLEKIAPAALWLSLAAVTPALAVDKVEAQAAVVACLEREAPRFEQIEPNLESVARLTVQACIRLVWALSDGIVDESARRPDGSIRLSNEFYDRMRARLAVSFERQASELAVAAREARLKQP